ncbi:unnamed protein product, partial [Amoebophrya sp. A25]|eukprot:GSA25T00024958001.1
MKKQKVASNEAKTTKEAEADGSFFAWRDTSLNGGPIVNEEALSMPALKKVVSGNLQAGKNVVVLVPNDDKATSYDAELLKQNPQAKEDLFCDLQLLVVKMNGGSTSSMKRKTPSESTLQKYFVFE